MNARTTLLALLAFALAGTACGPPNEGVGPLSAEDMAAIRAVPESYTEAMLANDFAAVAEHFEEDAVVMPPDAPLIEGRAAIQAEYEAIPGRVTAYSNTPVEIDGRGDLAYARGTIQMTVTVEGGPEPIHDSIKYLVILRKQPDGSWLLSRVSWNSEPRVFEEGEEAET